MSGGMDLRPVGGQGMESSPVILGCMGMSGTYGARDDKESVATIQQAIELGVNVLDTADFYGSGHNELLIREAIRGRRDKVALSVKFGGMRNHDGAFVGHDARPAAIRNFLTYSLVRLGVDEIDFYFPGRVVPDVPIEEVVGTLGDLVGEGKVRYVGLSEASAATIEKAHRIFPITALQTEYSLFTRDIEAEILPTTRRLGIGLLSYAAFSRGLFAQPPAPGQDFSQGYDIRHRMPRFQGENLTRNLALAQRLEAFARKKGCSLPQLSLAWVLAQGPDVFAVCGTSRRAHLEENVGAADLALTREEIEALNALVPRGAVAGERYSPALLALTNR